MHQLVSFDHSEQRVENHVVVFFCTSAYALVAGRKHANSCCYCAAPLLPGWHLNTPACASRANHVTLLTGLCAC